MPKRTEPVDEALVRLEVEGEPATTFGCTPERLDALAAGWLVGTGAVSRRADLIALQTVPGRTVTVRVALAAEPAERWRRVRRHRAAAGCGVRHFLDCEPGRLAPRARGSEPAAPDRDAAADLFARLYAGATRYQDTGGLHVAALASGGALVAHAEDVGRHNAVDKVIGTAVLDDVALAGCGLVVSSRVSAEIAHKAALAGLGWIASRSVPTTLALEIAGAAGVAIIARAAGAEPRTFTARPP